jgi:hypothetical protein
MLIRPPRRRKRDTVSPRRGIFGASIVQPGC